MTDSSIRARAEAWANKFDHYDEAHRETAIENYIEIAKDFMVGGVSGWMVIDNGRRLDTLYYIKEGAEADARRVAILFQDIEEKPTVEIIPVKIIKVGEVV